MIALPPPWDAPEVLLGGAALAVLALFGVLILSAVARSRRDLEPLLRQVHALGHRVETLGQGQHQLAGGLTQVADAQARGQAQTVGMMEHRLAEVAARLGESVQGASTRTAHALGGLGERLETIDRAQAKIEQLAGDVLGLQDILANKQARGAFGEIQLHDILAQALPPDAWEWQATLSNGKRVDALVRLPAPPGPLPIDAKFPLEPYAALRDAADGRAKAEAARQFATAVRSHIRAIAAKYILPGETAEGALMFLPSEAVYAELHAYHGAVVREGFTASVWIVSPTTCMATLHTLRAVLKDSRIRAEAEAIRQTTALLHRDVALVTERVGKLRSHFEQVRGDLDGITTAAERAGRRAERLEALDFGEEEVGPSRAAGVRIVRTGEDSG